MGGLEGQEAGRQAEPGCREQGGDESLWTAVRRAAHGLRLCPGLWGDPTLHSGFAPCALSNCTYPFTGPGSCPALSFLPVLLMLLVLYLSPSFKALL